MVPTNLFINSGCVILDVKESPLLFLIYKVGWKYIQDKNHAILAAAKAKLFCLKSFVPFTRAGVFIWKNVHLGYRDLGFSTGQHNLSYEHIEIFT